MLPLLLIFPWERAIACKCQTDRSARTNRSFYKDILSQLGILL